MLPSGQQGKRFINELTHLFEAFNHQSALESVAIKAAMCMPFLLLQKPHIKSKVRHHIASLKRRLDLWESGDFSLLVKEGEMIQRRLQSQPASPTKDRNRIAWKFAKLMTSGKTRAAIHSLSEDPSAGIHHLDDVIDGKTVREILKDKHPTATPAANEVLVQNVNLDDQPENLHILIFEDISVEDIRYGALHTEGSPGPSGCDAMAWRRFCSAFGDCSNSLCAALASFAKRISTSYVDPICLSAYTASRLIPLNKSPGVRPIGVGEVCRRIIGKVIMKYSKADLRRAVGPLQLCAGFESGCEAAIHAMSEIFEEEETEVMILLTLQTHLIV